MAEVNDLRQRDEPVLDRRGLFSWTVGGLTGAALTSLLLRDGVVRAETRPGETPAPAAPPAKAKRVIHLCLCGGVSHIDTFDFKPALAKYHGKPLPSSEKPETFFGQIGLLRKNDWDFQQRGKSGLWI